MEFTDALLVGIIMALTEVLKKSGLPKRFTPLASVSLGLLGGIFLVFPGDLKSGIISGLIIGLSACGLYSGGKTVTKMIKNDGQK